MRSVQSSQAVRNETPPVSTSLSVLPASPQAPAPPREIERTTAELVGQAIQDSDYELLRELAARPGGFGTRELRKRAWPLLMHCENEAKDGQPGASEGNWDTLPARDDERQVRLDIDRSLVNFPHGKLRVKLERAILTVLRRHPALHYFQGYHDIISVLLLTLEEDALVTAATERMSLHRVRDSMGPGLEPTLGYLKVIDRLVKVIDPELYTVVSQAASMPFFALSWALTLFSHDIDSVAVLARIFDFLLAHNPSMICHLVVALLLHKKESLLEVADTSEADPAMIHSALSQLPHIVLASQDTARAPSPPPPTGSASPSLGPSQSGPGEAKSSAAVQAGNETDDSEDLLSSASFLASASDLARSPTLTASSSVSTFELPDEEADLDASVISASEIEVEAISSTSGLRHRRRSSAAHPNRAHSTALASQTTYDYDADGEGHHGHGDDEDSLHTLDESMFSDPDIEGLAFQPFPTSSAPVPTTPPRHSETSRSGHVIVSASEAPESPSHLPPRTTVDVDELIADALQLSKRYPIPAPGDPAASLSAVEADASSTELLVEEAEIAEAAAAIRAERILGPNSCVFTWKRSMEGALSDEAAEEIVRLNEGIVFPEALGPDPEADELSGVKEDEDEVDSEAGDADSDEYDVVPSSPNGGTEAGTRRRRRRSKHRRSSSGRSRLPPMLALGPHGWLVVSGVAVAAVAYGVYRQQGSVPAAASGVGGGSRLGTAGLGLGFGGFGNTPAGAGGAAQGMPVPAPAQGGAGGASGSVADAARRLW
ncbi:GTPase-activating protein gyp8 [Rhodotorula sphaerocarpa]